MHLNTALLGTTLGTSYNNFLSCSRKDFKHLTLNQAADGGIYLDKSGSHFQPAKISSFLIECMADITKHSIAQRGQADPHFNDNSAEAETFKKFVKQAIAFDPKIFGKVKNHFFKKIAKELVKPLSNKEQQKDYKETALKEAKVIAHRIEDTVLRIFNPELLQIKQDYKEAKAEYLENDERYRNHKEGLSQAADSREEGSLYVSQTPTLKDDYTKSKADYLDKEYLYKTASVRFAQTLNIEFEAVDAGANGTYFGYDFRHKKKLVFKPASEEQGLDANPKWTTRLKETLKKVIQVIFPFLISISTVTPGRSYLREVIASKIDRLLDLNIVPTTEIEKFTSPSFYGELSQKMGSCQLFRKSDGNADQVLNVPHLVPVWMQRIFIWFRKKFKCEFIDILELQKMAILDLIIGNVDRHGGNWLIQSEPKMHFKPIHSQNSIDAKLWAIDCGSSLRKTHCDDYNSQRHYFAFTMYPQAKKEFTSEAKHLIRKIAENKDQTRDKIKEIIQTQLGYEYQEPALDMQGETMVDSEGKAWTIERTLEDRLSLFGKVVDQTIKNPKQLGKYKSAAHFKKIQAAGS